MNGISPRRDPVEGRLVGVVDADAEPGVREGQAQGQADVAAAAEDDDVEIGASVGHGHESSRAVHDVTAPMVLVVRVHRSVGVAVDLLPARTHEPLGEGRVLGEGHDEPDIPSRELLLPTVHAGRDQFVALPDVGGE